jgi:Flp pilus assembly protein TadG
MVEFALVSMTLMVIVLGMIDFSYLFLARSSALQATRAAARFAAVHPTAWTAVAPIDRNTIEGNLKLSAVPASISNIDADMVITYLMPGGVAAPVLCGKYLASTGFVGQNSYSQAGCVKPGNLVNVQARYHYTFITPMLKSTFTNLLITTDATSLIEA